MTRQSDGAAARTKSKIRVSSLYMAGGVASGGLLCRSPSAGVIQRDDIINNQSINEYGPSAVT